MNKIALFSAIADALAMWSNPRFTDKYPDPRDSAKRVKYVVGTPREVRFTPYPEVFFCGEVQRTARFSDLMRRGAATNGKCCICGGKMNRLRYVQAHNCGRLEEIFLPLQGCPKGHGPEHLAFYDPGRVKQARWYCAQCNTDIQALRMTPCNCAYNDSLPPGRQPEKWLKIVPNRRPMTVCAAYCGVYKLYGRHARSSSRCTGDHSTNARPRLGTALSSRRPGSA